MSTVPTVRAFFDAQFKPLYLADARPRTIAEYGFTVTAWDRWFAAVDLATIAVETLATWRQKLSDSGLVPPTVNKHLRHLGAILAKAGPPGPHNRDALGVIDRTPWVRPLRWQRDLPRHVALDTIGRVYAQADGALYPRSRPGHYWRALVVCAYNLAYRRHALLHMPEAAIDWNAATVRMPANLDKCRVERIKPALDVVLTHLLPLRGNHKPLAWPHGNRAFYWQWHALQTAAGVDRAEHFTPHDLKRACGTQLQRAGANEWQIRYMLDHAQRDVTGRSYVNAADELREVLERLRQPPQFQGATTCPQRATKTPG